MEQMLAAIIGGKIEGSGEDSQVKFTAGGAVAIATVACLGALSGYLV